MFLASRRSIVEAKVPLSSTKLYGPWPLTVVRNTIWLCRKSNGTSRPASAAGTRQAIRQWIQRRMRQDRRIAAPIFERSRVDGALTFAIWGRAQWFMACQLLYRETGGDSGPERKAAQHRCSIRDHAVGQASALLRRLAFQANRTARRSDAASVHDLRVSIRRLGQCLRIFGQFIPRQSEKKFQHKLDAVMDLASAVRDRDIAMDLLAAARIGSDSALVWALSEERAGAERALVAALERWSRRGFQKKWRSRLEL